MWYEIINITIFGLNNIFFFFEIIKHCMLHYIVNKVSGLENKSYGL